MPPKDLTLIVAATHALGIGKNNALPWPMLKQEMAYFARVTKRVMDTSPVRYTPSPLPINETNFQRAIIYTRCFGVRMEGKEGT